MSASESHNSAFTDRQKEAYDCLPGNAQDIANDLDITRSMARDYISQLRNDCGVRLSQDEHGIYYDRAWSGESVNKTTPPDTPVEERSSLAQHTIKKKDVLLRMKRSLASTLEKQEPVMVDGGTVTKPDNEDVVIHRADDHLGAEYEDEFDNTVFNPEIGIRRVQSVTDKVMELVNRQKDAGVTFDNAHLLLGGDTVHGAGIHANQPWESALTLVEQVEAARDLYVDQIERLREMFKTVQVVCQNGNHGELRGDGMSDEANADDIVYMMLEKAANDLDWDDVTIVRSSGSYFTNFRMREDPEKDAEMVERFDYGSVEDLPEEHRSGHRGHLRHGQKSLFHIGTSSGKNRWRGWQSQHEFDIAYRGHFHEFRLEHIDSLPVLMSGSVCPPSDFEESIAEWSEPAATVHGVSDERSLTWLYPIDFDNGRTVNDTVDNGKNSVMSA